jgi:outer membrane protein assembly factor BamB
MDASWVLSNNVIASISSDSQPTVTALAVGQVTLTANVGAVSAQINVNVVAGLAGGLLPVGTPQWSIPSSGGFTAQASVRADPVDGAPDLYSVEQDSNGNVNVRALTIDGQQLWSASPLFQGAQGSVVPIGDSNGGLLLIQKSPVAISDLGYITDFDAQTGAILWSSILLHYSLGSAPAIASDGTIYMWVADGNTFFQLYPPLTPVQQPGKPPEQLLLALDGLTGILAARYPIPTGKQTNVNGIVTLVGDTQVTPPVIDADGTVWAAFVSEENESNTEQQTLSLLKIAPGGGASISPLRTSSAAISSTPGGSSGPFTSTYKVIPNSQGGILLSWSTDTLNPTNYVYYVSNVSADGGSADFTMPELVNDMVLGENGLVYGANFADVTAFDINSGVIQWTYRQPAAGLELVEPIMQAGLIVNVPNMGLVTLDSSGNPLASLGTVVTDPTPLALNSWTGEINGSFSLFSGTSDLVAASAFSAPKGNQQRQRRPPLVLKVSSDFPLTDLTKQQGIDRAFARAHIGVSYVTNGADVFVSNDPLLPPGVFGRDNDLSNHALVSPGNLSNAPGIPLPTAGQVEIALGVVIAHEFGHYLLQCIHFPDPWKLTIVYGIGELVTLNGKIYVSRADFNQNHQPDVNPDQWALVDPPPGVSDCGTTGIMKPGSLRDLNLLFHTDFGLFGLAENAFTREQAIVIQRKIRQLRALH